MTKPRTASIIQCFFFGFVLKKATLTPSDINLRNKIISEQQLQLELFKVPAQLAHIAQTVLVKEPGQTVHSSWCPTINVGFSKTRYTLMCKSNYPSCSSLHITQSNWCFMSSSLPFAYIYFSLERLHLLLVWRQFQTPLTCQMNSCALQKSIPMHHSFESLVIL